MAATLAVGCTQSNPTPYPFRETKLSNGLRVITLADHTSPVVAVQVWYHVGSVNESPDRQGFAHLFEHMMFRGTDRLGPKDHFEYIRRTGGNCNAYTSFDQTVYVNTVPSDQLELVLWLEAERMAFLKVDEEGYRTERKVVEEERRLRLNAPYGTVFEKMLPAIFARHPYRWTPIGKIPHLRAAGVDEVRAFWQQYYVPNNAVLVIAGDIDQDKSAELARRYFAWIPAGPQPPQPAPADQPNTEPVDFHLAEPKGPLPRVSLVYRTVPLVHADQTPLDFLEIILGDGRSSRLYGDLVKDRKSAVDVDASSWGLEYAGLFSLSATLPAGGDTAAVLDRLAEHVDRAREQPVTEAEFEKARNQLLRRTVTRSMTAASKASLLGRYATSYDDINRINRQLQEIRAVEIADVQRVARDYLVPARLTRVVVRPDKSAEYPDEDAAPPAGAAATSVERPTPGRPAGIADAPPVAPLAGHLPEIAHTARTLSNGLQVVVIEDHDLPFVRMTLGLKFGAWCESIPGTARMACDMLTRGTRQRSASQLAELLERRAITLDGSAGMDIATVNAACLTEHLGMTARLLAEVVTEPTFPADEFALVQTQWLNQLRVKLERPGYLADRMFRREIFGPHPYSRSAGGWIADIERLKADDAAAWWRRFARPDAAVLYLAGDVKPEQAFKLAEEALGDWQADGPMPKIELPEIPRVDATRILLIDRPGLVQSEIRLGHVGITRHNDRWFNSRVLTQIFGGAFNSRLMRSLRIEKGLTYGVGGSFVANRFSGEFRVRTFTKPESTADAVRAILEQIEIVRSTEPTAQELDVARSHLVGGLAVSRETPQSLANDLWKLEYCDLPDDYYQRYIAGIRKTSTTDVADTARELIQPEGLTILIVGDAKALRGDLEKIAPVTVLDD